MMSKVYFDKELIDKFLAECKQNYPEPGYTRGIFFTKSDSEHPCGYYSFETNDRMNDTEIKEEYESFGPYYKKHKGFVVSAKEMLKLEDLMTDNGEDICGAFHVHIDFPACPTRLDVEMFHKSVADIENVWCLIVSFLDPYNLDFKAFTFENKLIRELEIVYNEG